MPGITAPTASCGEPAVGAGLVQAISLCNATAQEVWGILCSSLQFWLATALTLPWCCSQSRACWPKEPVVCRPRNQLTHPARAS